MNTWVPEKIKRTRTNKVYQKQIQSIQYSRKNKSVNCNFSTRDRDIHIAIDIYKSTLHEIGSHSLRSQCLVYNRSE